MAGYRVKTAAGVVAAIALAAVLGSYLVLNYPVQANGTGTSKVPGILSVYSNGIWQVGPLPGLGYALAFWQASFGNSGGTPIYTTYQLLENGYLVEGNNSLIQPGQIVNASSCSVGVENAASFDFIVFAANKTDYSVVSTNQAGIVVPHYPVTVRNLTQVPYSGQFSSSAQISPPQYIAALNQTLPSLTLKITNTGSRLIEFLYVDLSNGTAAIGGGRLRCTGADNFPGTPAGYSEPLAHGQAENFQQWLGSPSGPTVVPGHAYTMTIAAVYSDHTEVIQTYTIQAPS